MRSHFVTFALALTLAGSMASLIGNPVAASPDGQVGCCICFDCDLQNSTSDATASGLDNESAVCNPATSAGQCENICVTLGCNSGTFENVTCTDPSLAEVCGEANVMAPAASPGALIALVGLLAGFGAFYLRRRSV